MIPPISTRSLISFLSEICYQNKTQKKEVNFPAIVNVFPLLLLLLFYFACCFSLIINITKKLTVFSIFLLFSSKLYLSSSFVLLLLNSRHTNTHTHTHYPTKLFICNTGKNRAPKNIITQKI